MAVGIVQTQMFDQIEALAALSQTGTTARAAVRLRITQSAVSKRIAALEVVVGLPLVQKRGRGLVLTPAGEELLREVEPHTRAVRDRVAGLAARPLPLRLAVAESLLASWLPEALASAAREASVALEMHAHRGPLVLERVRGGRADVAVCVSQGEDGLHATELAPEPMVLLGAAGTSPPDAASGPAPLWTIERRSLTGEWLERRLLRYAAPLVPSHRIESFAAAVQLARAGFGTALVPVGLARAMGVPPAELRELPGLSRPIAALCTSAAAARPEVHRFLAALASFTPAWSA
jgi:DNA-binding transcriptional LysR family regulator